MRKRFLHPPCLWSEPTATWASLLVAAYVSSACGSTPGEGTGGSGGNGGGTSYTFSGDDVYVGVVAGKDFACGLVQGGTVKCEGNNDFGQLGAYVSVGSKTPVAVQNVNSATALAAGDEHVCALLADGTVTCWGDNGAYELGNNLTDGTCGGRCSTVPLAVPGLSQVTAVFSGSGSEHSCALVGGALTCWGTDGQGQLCDGMSAIGAPPMPTVGLGKAAAAAAGFDFTCAQLVDGSVGCCGQDMHRVNPAPALSGVRAITASSYYACALLSDGTAQCWGGVPFQTNGSSTSMVGGLAGAVSIAAGDSHVCALLSDGTVACWGENTEGQLGPRTGTMMFSAAPVKVSSIASATAISAGRNFTCALVAGGRIQCWGTASFVAL